MFSLTFNVGGFSLNQLKDQLQKSQIGLNPSAEKLFTDPRLVLSQEPHLVTLNILTIAELKLTTTATLPNILLAAKEQGYKLCPLETAIYCRLFWQNQPVSDDHAMHRHKAPDSAVTIASPITSTDVNQPKGFYLRHVNNRLWLRGYICDDDFIWQPEDLFAFQK